MTKLKHAAYELHVMYSEDETLNDRFDIENLIPRSLDEWEAELAAFITDKCENAAA